VAGYGRTDEEACVAHLALADLSTHPRIGVRGPGSVGWLGSLGMRVPPGPNSGVQQEDGTVALRLSSEDFMLLSPIVPSSGWQATLSLPRAQARHLSVYMLPRAESHGWFALAGALAHEVLAKLCSIDLRVLKFVNGAVAQTSIARVDGVVARSDLVLTPCFHLLCDSSYTEYLWSCLLDAMKEFAGARVGVEALARHAGCSYQTLPRKSI